ncbi:MAG: ArnT family glycosyltransferase [Planctomycetota bacterium]
MKPKRKVKMAPKPMKVPAIEPEHNQKLAKYVAVGLLVVLGLAYSLHFLGHFVFPNPDFAAFLQIGQQWLSFRIPYTMKRAPLFTLITVLAGQFFSTPDRYLFGTELYNALMLPTVMVLIYLIGREFLGRAAIWVALLACISPSMVHMSSQPLAELTLVALFAATCLCIRSHIKWAYLFAMLGSISRWDMAGLIPAVALVDLIRNRKWTRTIIMTVLASIPFGICMILTWMQLRGQSGGAHYIQVLSKDRTFELAADLRFYWQHICSFLNAALLESSPSGKALSLEGLNSAVFTVTSLLLAIAFLGGSIAAVIKKRWEIIVMLVAGIPYVMVHAIYPYRLPRFCVPSAWAWLIISAYGTITFWRWFVGKQKPKFLIPLLQLIAAVIFILWAVKVLATLDYAQRRYCPVIERLALISSLVTVGGFFGLQLLRRSKLSMKWLIIPAFLLLAVVSNAATTGLRMGNGQSNANFKRLGIWFLENAADDDRMITTMPGWMPIYTGLPSERFEHMVHIPPLEAKDFPAFIQECRKRKITLIAWDSRLAGRPNDRYYKEWGLDRIRILGSPKAQIGPCQLVHTLKGSPGIAVYRILPTSGS